LRKKQTCLNFISSSNNLNKTFFYQKANIDGNAKHIVHAVNAQHLIQMTKHSNSQQMHHFPAFPNINPNTLRAREAIKRAQQELEAKQRAEEDALLMV
jgi:hypothetical protein